MTPFGLPPWVVMTLLFAIGAIVARWINVCVERIPYREYLGDQWRACTDQVAQEDVVRAGLPIIGPLTSGGVRVFGSRGRGGRAAFVELATGLLLAALYWCELPPSAAAPFAGGSLGVAPPYDTHLHATLWSPVVLVHLRFVCHAILLISLLSSTLVDVELKIIPSITTDPFTAVGVVLAFVVGGLPLAPLWFTDPLFSREFLGWVVVDDVPGWIAAHPHWHGLAASVAGVVVGGGLVLVLRVIGGWTLGREAMGAGDVYLMMTIGAFLGWQAAVVVFFLAPIAALAVHAVRWVVVAEAEIPYGPYLSAAAVAVLFGWNEVFPMVRTIFSLGPVLGLLALFMTVVLAGLLLLMRLLKQLAGIPLDWDDWPEEEFVPFDEEEGDTERRRPSWPGAAAAAGTSHYEAWLNPD